MCQPGEGASCIHLTKRCDRRGTQVNRLGEHLCLSKQPLLLEVAEFGRCTVCNRIFPTHTGRPDFPGLGNRVFGVHLCSCMWGV